MGVGISRNSGSFGYRLDLGGSISAFYSFRAARRRRKHAHQHTFTIPPACSYSDSSDHSDELVKSHYSSTISEEDTSSFQSTTESLSSTEYSNNKQDVTL